jgi:BirA family biotin operon repressor/biotin-[acetyl-CoA-carboxylase] ligase
MTTASPSRLADVERALAARVRGAIGRPCHAFAELPSTMDEAHRLAREGAAHGACVWADRQTAGRGRAGRAWASPDGGVYVSLILRPTRPATELPQVALVAGLGVAEALAGLGLSPVIRWPNDVLLEERKVCGILAEASADRAGASYAIVGLGVNVATDPSALPEVATSLAAHRRPAPDRLDTAIRLFEAIEAAYVRWNRDGFADLRPLLLRRLGWLGRLVHITTPLEAFDGQALDVDDAGRLLVRLETGMVRAVEMGDVTLLR